MTPTLKAKLREELGSLTSDAKLNRVYRAVLEGIREPTEAMAHAGATDTTPRKATNSLDRMYESVGNIYRAMIDALLSQGEAVE